MINWLNRFWYTRHPARWLLYPFSLLFQMIASGRRFWLSRARQRAFDVPIIVVGNISSGGVGKTPLVIALAQHFQQKGYRTGVVSRGYKAKTTRFPRLVTPEDEAIEVGDEPLLIARKLKCPVVIDPDRVAAVEYLLKNASLDIIISDDGLQHYRMGRTLEIGVIDGQRGLGNRMCLPAGPLREPAKRLRELDLIVVNSGVWPGAFSMACVPSGLTQVNTGKLYPLDKLAPPVLAISGIGNPARFHQTLETLSLEFAKKVYSDHHAFSPADIPAFEGSIIMTGKDAIKIETFAPDNCYSLDIAVKLDGAFWKALDEKLIEKSRSFSQSAPALQTEPADTESAEVFDTRADTIASTLKKKKES